MININRREVKKKPWLKEYSADGGPWFRGTDLYDVSRKLQKQGLSGPATAYAANGTPSFVGTIEHWAGLRLVESDIGGLRVIPYVEHYWSGTDEQ